MTKVKAKPVIEAIEDNTRAQWAERIRVAHEETVGAVLKLGRTLLAAKKALPHGEFSDMIEHDLPFTASTAQRLMKISADPRIANAARAQLLPPAWGTLYELTKVSTEAFEQAAASGVIHSEMTREDAKSLKVSIPPERRVPCITLTKEGTPPPASTRRDYQLIEKLERLEEAVNDLSTGGAIPAGSDAERRIRLAAVDLLSLTGQGRESLN